jgi:hypothetical protein
MVERRKKIKRFAKVRQAEAESSRPRSIQERDHWLIDFRDTTALPEHKKPNFILLFSVETFCWEFNSFT